MDTLPGAPEQKKRYIVMVSYYLPAFTDEEALKNATDFTADMNDKYDCQASVDGLAEHPYGSLQPRVIF